MADENAPPGDRKPKRRVIFRRFRTDPRTGKTLDARTYGLRAWPIPVED